MSSVNVFVHAYALNESDEVGTGTKIWAFAHVMKGAVIGIDCNVGGGAFIESGARIGDRVTIKNNVSVWDGVTVQDDVFLGPSCVLTNRKYPRSRHGQNVPKKNWDNVVIQRGASIGAGAVLVCPLVVGEEALVGAGSVVTKNIAPRVVVAGNPAREIGWVCNCGAVAPMEEPCQSCGATQR